MKKKIILGSASPRRRELLEQIGVEFEVRVSSRKEVYRSLDPASIVKELALAKAENVAEELGAADTQEKDLIVIGADTVVVLDGEILGKPKDEADAERMLKALQGRAHDVYTGAAFLTYGRNGEKEVCSYAVGTKVYVNPMTEKEIRAYIATGEPSDKAGAYGIQGRFAAYIEKIEGDYYNVVGLPVWRGGVRGRRACLEEASAQEETEKQFPDEQEKEGSEDSGGNIQQDSRLIADHKRQAVEYDLLHLIVRIDIEHVYFPKAVEGKVEHFRCRTADEIQPCAACEGAQGIFVSKEIKINHAAEYSKQNQKNMPHIGMYGERGIRIMQPAGVREYGDPAQECVAHQKCQQGAADFRPAEPGIDKQDVHGYAAELKRKVPPVIGPASQRKGERILLPDLAGQHQKTAQE